MGDIIELLIKYGECADRGYDIAYDELNQLATCIDYRLPHNARNPFKRVMRRIRKHTYPQ